MNIVPKNEKSNYQKPSGWWIIEEIHVNYLIVVHNQIIMPVLYYYCRDGRREMKYVK